MPTMLPYLWISNKTPLLKIIIIYLNSHKHVESLILYLANVADKHVQQSSCSLVSVLSISFSQFMYNMQSIIIDKFIDFNLMNKILD